MGSYGFNVTDDGTIYVADYSNHRIIKWAVDANRSIVEVVLEEQEMSNLSIHMMLQLTIVAIFILLTEVIEEYNENKFRLK